MDSQLADRFQQIADEAQTMTFMPRAIELQRGAVERVDEFIEVLAAHRASAIAAADEESANAMLATELSLRTVREELGMWITLKENRPEDAWNHLISAQDLCASALTIRAQIGMPSQGLQNLEEKLLVIERVVFPPQVFMSVGGRAKYRECSICHSDYEECGHVKGRAYMGETCHVILAECELEEVSLVDDPADKRCRVTHFSNQGQSRNRMTWRLEDPPGSLPALSTAAGQPK
jgi:hypothetical protein